MLRTKFQTLFQSLRHARVGAAQSKARVANKTVLDDIGKESTAVGNVLRLRAQEQSIETLLRERVYQETTEPLEQLKEISQTPTRRKKRSTKRSKRRAAEMLTALTRASNKEPSAVSEKIAFPASNLLARLSKEQPSTANVFRRHSFMFSCASYPDLLPPSGCERSSHSFISDSSKNVEAAR